MDKVIVSSEEKPGNIYIVYINGNIICNLSGTPVRAEVDRILANDNPKIILNIKDVRYLDSYSFSWLAKVFKEAKAKGGSFAISNPNQEVAYLMEMVRFSQAVSIFDTEEQALRALSDS